MIEKTYVIAGNYGEFISYSKDKNNQVYIQDIYRLYGLRNPKVNLIGTYYKRKDWQAIADVLNNYNYVYQAKEAQKLGITGCPKSISVTIASFIGVASKKVSLLVEKLKNFYTQYKLKLF